VFQKKILVLDDNTVHVRLYPDKFETNPKNLNSSELKFIIRHVPIGTTALRQVEITGGIQSFVNTMLRGLLPLA
jgi:hypothetical protein